MELGIGKLPVKYLRELLALMTGVPDEDVIVGPRIGEDAAIIKVGNRIIAVHVDPITEADAGSARLAIIVASNDIAVSGVRPRWALVALLLPQGYSMHEIRELARSIGATARRLNITIVGGHTEISPGISKPIIVTTVIGETGERFIPTGGAEPGDLVLQVRPAALEGTYILATDFRDELLKRGVPIDVIERAAEFIEHLSVIEPALKLSSLDGIHSMHDPTEGGLIGGLMELALSSNTSINVNLENVVVRPETIKITRALNIDWTRLLSSGTIIATIKPDLANILSDVLAGYDYSIIGKVSEYNGCPLYLTEQKECVYEVPQDEIAKMWHGG